MINTKKIRHTRIRRRGSRNAETLPPGHVKATTFRLHLADYLRAEGTFIVHKYTEQYEVTIKQV